MSASEVGAPRPPELKPGVMTLSSPVPTILALGRIVGWVRGRPDAHGSHKDQ
jgi:hypothetical protein